MKKTLLVLIAISLIGCKAKTITIETHTTDTLRVEKIVRIIPAQLNSLVIDSPCDSLGNLKPFMYSFGTNNNKLSIKAKNNTIYVTQDLDSVKSVWEKEYKAKTSTSEIVKIKYKTPVWVWKLIAGLLFVVLIETLIIVKRWTI